MRPTSFPAIVLLAFVACEEVPPPASPSKGEASSSSSSDSSPAKPMSEEDAAREARPRPASRPSAVAIADLQKQEKLLASTAKTAPDRPKLLQRLADGYMDLAADAKDPKVAATARRKAIDHYQEIVKEHRKSASDEILYELARAYEASGDLKNARAVYYELIKRFPSSPLVARAYYAVGVIYREEARKDPSKWTFAEQAFAEAKQLSPTSDPIHRLALAEEAGAATSKPSASALAAQPTSPTSAPTSAPAKPTDVAPPAPAPAPEPAKIGTDGTYVAKGGNYRLQAKFEPGKIVITEPNQTSVYVQEGSSRVFRWFDEKLKTAFFLEVAPDGKTLFAYKTGTMKNSTELTLLTAGAPSEQCKAPPLPIEVQNVNAINPNKERLFGVRKNDEVNAAGEYRTRGKHPYITLPDGGIGGMFEVSGAADQPENPEWKYPIKQWWLQANCDGTLVSQTFPKGKLYYVIVEYERAYQGMKFDRFGLQVPTSGNMVLLDRTKTSP